MLLSAVGSRKRSMNPFPRRPLGRWRQPRKRSNPYGAKIGTSSSWTSACRGKAGKTIKQIAGEISLSVKTVSTYRSRILEKTGLKTTAELIRYALQSQLVD